MLLPCGNAYLRKIIRWIRYIRVRLKKCSFYQQSSFRTRIIRIFTDVIALWQYLLEKSNPLNPFNPCSLYQQSSFRTRIIKIFTDVIALRQCLLEKIIRSIRPIRVRFKSVRFTNSVLFEHELYGFSRMLLPCGNTYLRKLSVQSVKSAFETLTN